MQQKPITISTNEFNEKIKNNLRDYYVYQFKRFRKDDTSDYRKKGTNENKPASTFTEEKQRLLSMLESQTQMEWTMEKGGVCCCTVDTRTLNNNPFWEPYRFCAASPRYLGWFLSMILVLHPQIQLRDPLGLPEPVFPRVLRPFYPGTTERMKAQSKENLQDWLQFQIAEIYGDMDWGNFFLERFLSVSRQKINGRKMILEEDPERFGIPRELLQWFYSQRGGRSDVGEDQFKNRLNDICAGILRSKRISQRKEQWRLGDNPLSGLPEDKELLPRFQEMLGYFSQTLPLGFVGTCLLRRTGNAPAHIRYKHSYITKALNDYNIADLLQAIQQKIWIRLDYRNGTNLRYQYMVCFPLQIRESTQDGRQYLMYYHPGYRSLGALRLDFIDKITYGTVDEQPYYAQDIIRAQQTLPFIWGSSVPGFFEGNMIQDPRYTHVKLVIRKDLPVIETRLFRESRHGRITSTGETVTYEADVIDPGEMIPWIRSFSPRVQEIGIDGVGIFPQQSDPTTSLRAHLNRILSGRPQQPDRHEFREDVVFHPKKAVQYPHEHLFNPVFSLAFDTVAQVVFHMMQQPDRYQTRTDLIELICGAWPVEIQLQDDMLESIYENITLLCSGNGKRGYRLDYIPTESFIAACHSLWDMIPLSDLETSYLKGILQQPKAKLFLSPVQIETILSGMSEDVAPMDFSAIYYYDQHRDLAPYYNMDVTRKNFSALMESAITGHVLDAVYASQRETASAQLSVIYLEYSKREDKFWACCADAFSRISFRNLERFVSAVPAAKTADMAMLQDLAATTLAATSRKLVINFTDEKNRAERLVTEFSPWKKKCTCSLENDIKRYTMELFYDSQDAFEIAIRLLSYGDDLHILEDSGNVAHQLRLRRRIPEPAL